MNAVYIGNNKVLTYLWNSQVGIIVPSTDDNLTTLNILVGQGTYEDDLTKYFMKNIKPAMTCVDVGCNIGYFSLLMGMKVDIYKGGKVFCFEANPNLIPIIKSNMNMHYFSHCKVINALIGSNNDEIIFNVNREFSGNSSINNVGNQKTEQIKMKTTRLDDYYDEFGIVDYMKIDIEGSEYDAFLGAEKLIKNKRIRNIIFEYNVGMLGCKNQLFLDLLKSYNCQIYNIDKNGDKYQITFDELIKSGFCNTLIEF